MLVKQLADEVGPAGGRAFGVLPGSIGTDRMTYLLGQAPDPAASYVTGCLVPVDGGAMRAL